MQPPGLIDRLQRHSRLAHLPLHGIALDLALLVWATLLRFSVPWIWAHLSFLFNWVWLLHCLTFYSVMLGLVVTAPPKEDRRFNLVVVLFIVGALVSISSPIWLFLTPLAGGGSFASLFWNTLGMLSCTIVACLFLVGRYYSRRITLSERIIRFLVPIVYLAVSEVILYHTARSPGIGAGIVITGMGISYIPFRLLMIFTPPRSPFELLTATLAFGYFILVLTGVLP